MSRLMSFNPITSSKTKKVETRADGAVIYSHTASGIAGRFITVNDHLNWATSETIEEAREVSV